MQSDDQAFLDQIEQNIRSKDDEQEDAKQEAEQRAREMERIRKASSSGQIPGSKVSTPAPSAKQNELENDPRYREYFERLKRQKGITTPPTGVRAPAKTSTTSATPAPAGGAQTISPGSIVRFDDGSIGVYKDAVSGRDYALFYFLHPDGQFVPEGVFLQCYQAKVIGALPESYFSRLRDENTWERDLILFHLNNYEHIGLLNNVSEHEERKPKPGSKPKAGSVTTSTSATPAAEQDTVVEEKSPQQPSKEVSKEPAPKTAPQTSAPQKTAPEVAPQQEGLVKGRRFQIKFSGKQWEAVYWADDPDGSIVAHSTHGHWSLMRLDLERFKDSLELGDLVDGETLEAIANDAAAEKK